MAYQSYPPYHQQQQQPLPGGYYPSVQAQAQAQAPPVDPFRGYYADRLRQLTFNSRPIIQDLSMMAMAQRDQNNWNNMRTIVEEIENATLRAPSHQKLPLLYLIDSISKNLGPPYTTHLLPAIIPRLYLKTYREVDGVTKAKMEEMIALWRTSGVNGAELYGAGVRESVEREIFGSSGPSVAAFQRPMPSTSSMGPGSGAGPSRQQVLTALQTTLEAKHRASAANPNDPTLSHQVGVLVRIGELLNSTNVSPQELAQIMSQLNSMAPPPPRLAPTPQHPPVQAWSSQPITTPIIPPAGHAALNLPPFPPSMSNGPNVHPLAQPPFSSNGSAPQIPIAVRSPLPGSSTPIAAPVPVSASAASVIAPIIPVDVADILRKLTSSGVTSQPLTPELKPAELEQPKSTLVAYEDMILNLNVNLDSLDLNAMHTLSYSHLPQRCKQCGMRFPGMADGEAKLQAHLDWHFRRNRKERESGGRGAHRRWLPRAEEWITDIPEAGPSSVTVGSPGKNQQQPSGEVTKEELTRLREKWVVVPQDSNKGSAGCPICKEAFKAEWSDQEEEWIFRNAVNINGAVWHATCRAESRKRNNKLKAVDPRGRTLSRGRTASGSPNVTPQPQSLHQQQVEAGKRKAGAGETTIEGESKRIKVEDAENGTIPVVSVEQGEGDGHEGEAGDVSGVVGVVAAGLDNT